MHGAPYRFADPARFSFAHGGKDRHPFPVPLRVYDETIHVLKSAVRNAKLGRQEGLGALKRIDEQARLFERYASGPPIEELIVQERARSHHYGGRSVFGWAVPPTAPHQTSSIPSGPHNRSLPFPCNCGGRGSMPFVKADGSVDNRASIMTWSGEHLKALFLGHFAASVAPRVLRAGAGDEGVDRRPPPCADEAGRAAARAVIVDEDALYAALKDGRLGGAALDVWWQYPTEAEPERRPARRPFHELPNVLITPHNSSSTEATADRRWGAVAANLDRFARGKKLENIVLQT